MPAVRKTRVRRLLLAMAMLSSALMVATVMAAPAQASTAVKKVQKRLNALGCAAGPVDGRSGEWTRAAIIRFQSRHGMRQSGRLTTATRNKLYAPAAKRCDVRPVPPHAGKGRRIVISQRQNWVWLVRAGGKVARQGGVIDNPRYLSPGWGKVRSYCGRTAKIRNNSSANGLRLGNFTRFSACGIGFHRVPQYRPSGRQIHSDHLLGTNLRASHGCIRISRSMSESIWDFASIGTRVRVVR